MIDWLRRKPGEPRLVLAGREVPVPESLAELLSLPRQETELEPTLQALRAEMQKTR